MRAIAATSRVWRRFEQRAGCRRSAPDRWAEVQRRLAGEQAFELTAGDRGDLVNLEADGERGPQHDRAGGHGAPVGGVGGKQDLPGRDEAQDLHWSDDSTLDLVSRLALREEPARLLGLRATLALQQRDELVHRPGAGPQAATHFRIGERRHP
jgi:hypothetical protein